MEPALTKVRDPVIGRFLSKDPVTFTEGGPGYFNRYGYTMGDPVNGRFQLMHTTDGETWEPLVADMPQALPGEGGFAASGTCLIMHGESGAWFCTGGPNGGRVFHSTDRGKTWTAQPCPLTAGTPSAGVFGITFRDRSHGMIVGGDYTKPTEAGANAAVTTDGGTTWVLTDPLPFRSCATWTGDRWVAAGTSGIDAFDGTSWRNMDSGKWNAVAFNDGTGWAVGPDGRVGKYTD